MSNSRADESPTNGADGLSQTTHQAQVPCRPGKKNKVSKWTDGLCRVVSRICIPLQSKHTLNTPSALAPQHDCATTRHSDAWDPLTDFVHGVLNDIISQRARDDNSAQSNSETVAPSVSVSHELCVLIREVADKFLELRSTTEDPFDTQPAFSTLINVLFHQYFLLIYLPTEPTMVKPDPLLIYLLRLCDPDSTEALGPSPALHTFFFGLLYESAEHVTVNTPENEDGSVVKFMTEFCLVLQRSWDTEKTHRLNETTHSPMPWSASSRKAGIPPSPESFDYDAQYFDSSVQSSTHLPSVHDDLLYFPNMAWLGGCHDGHCLSWSLSAYVWIRLSTLKSNREHLALWQSALSFGVLETISGVRIPEYCLLSSVGGSMVFTSKQVSQFLSFWLGSATTAENDLREKVMSIYETISSALQAVNEALIHPHSGILANAGLDEHEQVDMICSLFSLLQFIFVQFGDLFVKYGMFANTRDEMQRLFSGYILERCTRRYRARLVANGWCPCAATTLSRDHFLSGYACTVPPFCRSLLEHATCTSERCAAHNMDPNTYNTQHAPSCTSPSTSCALLSPPFTRVSDLLSDGQIPVLVYADGVLKASSAEQEGNHYIAISHVWADGLGSTTEIGLPTCQVVRIASLARQLLPEGNGAFWVDSLCVPQKKELRKRAIILMAQTYSRADKVVVFDAGIRTFCTTTSHDKEIVLRILTSSWMQRVWTLQEAMLARTLYFEVSDGLIPITRLNDVMEHSMASSPSPLGDISRDPLMVALMITLHLMFGSGPGSINRRLREASDTTYTLDEISQLLFGRTTSKPEDEPLAIAGLLGIDTSPLLAGSEADMRMRMFWLELKVVPASIMLFPDQERLPYRGFRWAPRTLTTLSGFTGHHGTAQCTLDGLTTDNEFTLILFSPVELGGTDKHPDSIIIFDCRNPSIRLYQSNFRGSLGERTISVNGVVAVPHAFDSEPPEGSVVEAAAVHIETPPSSNTPQGRSVLCEHLLEIRLHVLPFGDSLNNLSQANDVIARKYEAAIMEGQFTSARITMT